MSTAAGGRISQPACQSCAMSVAPARPMLVLVSETTRSAPNIRSVSSDGSAPSASEITASDEARADERAGADGDERRGPHARADLGRRRDQRVQHEHGERRGERELRDVEGDLDRLGAAHPQQHEQRAEDLREDQLRRRGRAAGR